MAAFVGFCYANWLVFLALFIVTYITGWSLKVAYVTFVSRILNAIFGFFLVLAIFCFFRLKM